MDEEEVILNKILLKLTDVRDGFQVLYDRGVYLPSHGKILVQRKLQEIYELAEDVCKFKEGKYG
jgi:hypothetical protein